MHKPITVMATSTPITIPTMAATLTSEISGIVSYEISGVGSYKISYDMTIE
jgi:hypothetical protein